MSWKMVVSLKRVRLFQLMVEWCGTGAAQIVRLFSFIQG
ncbi:hypothetical protein SC09_Contig19orf00108 [Bacillus subtilis]|uniref:Uncharacterized protein n=1 Tax=Bacillus subtilis TaxID=1423 RepID=A0A0D1IR35_BACIU|nr:hypothetical protein SC09_Contig19orf00108 [Bacillus subtilis]